MRRIAVGIMALLPCGLLSSSLCLSPTAGIGLVEPASAASAFVNVIDNAVTLTPSATDYNNDYVEITGASGLRLDVKSNSATGFVLYVKCTDAAPQIRLADFLVRTRTAPGTGGSTMAAYTALTAVEQALWSTGVPQGPFQQVNVDIRIRNLSGYVDAAGGGATGYTNTLTFTVIVQ